MLFSGLKVYVSRSQARQPKKKKNSVFKKFPILFNAVLLPAIKCDNKFLIFITVGS